MLLTQKAAQVLTVADVVLYDYLVHPTIVLMAVNAQKICVGKKKGAHSTQQSTINRLLVELASQGKRVVRLKGGDPMVFGRCGEEMAALSQAGIQYEIIPGITSAVAVPTYAGIPITHRDFSHSVAFVTATRANPNDPLVFPNADTLVIMMSLLRLNMIVTELKTQRPSHTPIAIIESGTLASERVLVGTLETIEELQKKQSLRPPALMVVGDVVKLRTSFDWRRHLPLKNQRFVIFRPVQQQSVLAQKLSMVGAETLAVSLNQITHQSLAPIDFSTVTVIVFTSYHGVQSFSDHLVSHHQDWRALGHARVVAIGTQTQLALAQFGMVADIRPKEATSEGILEVLLPQLSAADHVLIPTSSQADDALMALDATGAKVTKVISYTNTLPPNAVEQLKLLTPTDRLVFMNAASVHRLYSVYPGVLNHSTFSIGPKTTAALAAVGVTQIIQSNESSIDSLVEKITQSV
jgi:uroporphyrinogen III methyltransferase/synthase